MIGLKLGADPLRPLGAPLRLRQAHRRRPARRAAGHRARRRRLLGLVDRQPADRPGPGGHADADGHGLHGDRQPRRHAPARTSWPATASPAARAVASAPPPRCRGCSRACSARAAPRRRPRSTGYKLAGKTGTAEKPDGNGGYSKTKFVASFIGFAPARNPRLLVAVMVDEPQGEIYGGTVAAPGVRADHRVRAPVPEDPAVSRLRGLP